jgi:hypothetical protein
MIRDVRFIYGTRATHQRFDATFDRFFLHGLATHQRFDAMFDRF